MRDHRKRMRNVRIGVVAGLVVAVAAGASMGQAADPYTKKLKDGSTFHLASSIQDKIKGEKVNYVFSYGARARSRASRSSTRRATTRRSRRPNKHLPDEREVALPAAQTQQDVTRRSTRSRRSLNTNQVDCLSIEPQSSTSMAALVAPADGQGHPGLHRRALVDLRQRVHELHAGARAGRHTAAATVVSYMKAHNLHFKTFAVSGGDPTQYWAQNRAKGFREGITKAIPGAKFVTTEKNMLNTTYDPAKTLRRLQGVPQRQAGKNVDVIENVDIGAGIAARALKDAGRPARRSASAGT